MTDLIKQATKRATKKKTDKKKDAIYWDPENEELFSGENEAKNLAANVKDLVVTSTIAKLLKPVVEQKQGLVADKLFDKWTELSWEKKKVLSNPYIVVNKPGTQTKDMQFMFLVKYRQDARKNFLPDEEDLEKGETFESFLIKHLTSKAVGLTKTNAKKLVTSESDGDGDFVIESKIDTAGTFNAMYYGDDPDLKSASGKLLSYIMASREAGDGETISLPYFTEGEQQVLVKKHELKIKSGFMERVMSYCKDLEQMRNLLKFIKVSLVCQNFEFAIGDEPKKQQKRMKQSVEKFLIVE